MPAEDLTKFEPSSDAEESLRRYFASLASGIGDPRLPLLTEGSRIFRVIVPRNEEHSCESTNPSAAPAPIGCCTRAVSVSRCRDPKNPIYRS